MIRIFALFLLTTLCACVSTTSLYAWGHYEDLIYSSYAQPGGLPPETQILKMQEDYQKAIGSNKSVPPGWHAHLGYLYAQQGQFSDAQRELMEEKTLFPESAVMMDRLLLNLRRQ